MKKKARNIGLLTVLLLVSSCALNSGQTKTFQNADVALYTAVAAIDDIESILYQTKVLDEKTHRQLNPHILTALKAGKAANDALIAWPRGDTKPPLAEFNAASLALTNLAKAVTDFVPAGPGRDSLRSKVDIAAAIVQGVLMAIGGAI